MHVVAKKVKNAAANDSNRLVNKPNPSSGKPSTLPPPGRAGWMDCVIFAASFD
jgi:hypothetical protein